MENASLIELKPDRKLLDPKFAGYKLSLDSIPMYIASSAKVDHVLRSEEQYSLQHVKLFGLHNHLFWDPWSLDDVYFIDEKWMVQRNVSSKETGRLTGLDQVWEIPSKYKRRAGHYNPSATFPAKDLVLLSDGAGTLYLAKSGDRQQSKTSGSNESQWQVLLSEEVCGAEVPFMIVNSVVVRGKSEESSEIVSERSVHCLLMHVEEFKKVHGQRAPIEEQGMPASPSTSFVTVLEWVILHEGKNGSWMVGRIRKLCGTSIPDYASFDMDGLGILVASEHHFDFITDTEKPLCNVGTNDETKKIETEEKSGIIWQQNFEEISLTIPVASEEGDANISGVAVNVSDGRKVCVTYRDQILLKGVTLNLVDHDLTTWELQDNKLNVCFHKAEEGKMWSKFLSEGGPEGEEKIDPNISEEIHNRLSHLTSEYQNPAMGSTPIFNSEELEECDEAPTAAVSLCRLDGETHVASHKTSISSNQWLFNVQMNPDNIPAICLRHGPDALLWQPLCNIPSETQDASGDAESVPKIVRGDWSYSHVASFITFGYVQASKQRKKFIACSPDASYVAVCEASQYIYIYRKPAQLTDAELRNRRTGEQIHRVARQHLITLPSSQEILGVHASLSTLYVLVEDKLLAYSVNE